MEKTFDIGWCRESGMANAVARFFVAHADPSYISHSELQFGRAATPGRWHADLESKLAAEAAAAIARAQDADSSPGTRLALARKDGALSAMAFVTFVPEVRTPFAVLEDLLVSPKARGGGLGRTMLDWTSGECRSAGIRRLFLESGLGNGPAHHFFERQGFVQTSIVMMREL